MTPLQSYLQSKRKLADSATPDWTLQKYGCVRGGPMIQLQRGQAQDQIAAFFGGETVSDEQRIRNAEFAVDSRTTYPKLLEALEKALDYVQQHQLSHAHNETEDNYRPLGDTYGWCCLCQEKVGLNEDWARETLADIERILEVKP